MTVTINGTGTAALTDASGNFSVRTATATAPVTVGRVDSSNEGGQIDFCRASDNANSWGIDVYGNTSTPSFRILDNVAASARLLIDSSGNIGIGTGSPSSKITASGGSSTFAHMNGGNSDTVPFLASVNDTNYATATYGWLWYNNATNGNLDLYRRVGSTSNTQVLTFDRASGTFLLGQTTNPATGTMVLKVPTSVGNGINAQITSNTGTSYPFSNYNASGTYVGGISCTSSATAFPTSSDYRLKQNVTPMTGALDRISALKPVTYQWKIDDTDGEGFIAHELQEVIPQSVFGEKDAVDADGKMQPQSVDYSKIVVHLVAAIQEQQAQIEKLKAKVAALESK